MARRKPVVTTEGVGAVAAPVADPTLTVTTEAAPAPLDVTPAPASEEAPSVEPRETSVFIDGIRRIDY